MVGYGREEGAIQDRRRDGWLGFFDSSAPVNDGIDPLKNRPAQELCPQRVWSRYVLEMGALSLV